MSKRFLLSFLLSLLSFLPPAVFAVEILLSTASIEPGQTLRVVVEGVTSNEKTRMSFAGGFYPSFPIGPAAQRALIGVRLDAVPGPYTLKFQHFSKKLGKWETVSETPVEISSKTFTIENVNFVPEKSALFQWEKKESAKIRQLLAASTPEQYWEGMFDYPVEGPIIGEFGIRRMRNNKIEAGFHKGYDIRAKEGTPLRAPAPGVILMASSLKAHGKTVLINHGQGVMTIYLHMKSMSVVPGQKIVRGQKIGQVGSTGLSTAPHVHWGLYVHGVAVDAKPWTETEF
jgi:murein DD-endopeptidase MepM/ murein hydrolase activator NlpD